MSKNEIIQSFYESKEIKEAIDKMEPEQLRKDLKQEMFMVLLEMEEERVKEMHEKGFLKFFLVRTMLNMVKSDRSTFYRNFRNMVEIGEPKEVIESEVDFPNIDLNEVFGNSRQGLYEKDMFLFYVFTFKKNAAALSQATKIPYKTVIRTITTAKNRIKCYLKSQQQ